MTYPIPLLGSRTLKLMLALFVVVAVAAAVAMAVAEAHGMPVAKSAPAKTAPTCHNAFSCVGGTWS